MEALNLLGDGLAAALHVLANLAAGLSLEELRRSYPGLGPEAVSAALALSRSGISGQARR